MRTRRQRKRRTRIGKLPPTKSKRELLLLFLQTCSISWLRGSHATSRPHSGSTCTRNGTVVSRRFTSVTKIDQIGLCWVCSWQASIKCLNLQSRFKARQGPWNQTRAMKPLKHKALEPENDPGARKERPLEPLMHWRPCSLLQALPLQSCCQVQEPFFVMTTHQAPCLFCTKIPIVCSLFLETVVFLERCVGSSIWVDCI